MDPSAVRGKRHRTSIEAHAAVKNKLLMWKEEKELRCLNAVTKRESRVEKGRVKTTPSLFIKAFRTKGYG